MKILTVFLLVLVAMQMTCTLGRRHKSHRNRDGQYTELMNMLNQGQAKPPGKCVFYLSFDGSVNGVDRYGRAINTTITTTGRVSIDTTANNAPFGSGSLFISAPGWLQVPLSKNFSLLTEATICFFERSLSGVLVKNDAGTLIDVNTLGLSPSGPNFNTQLCFVYNGQSITYYINGAVIVASVPSSGTLPPSSSLSFGSETTSGNMDEVLVCEIALTADEVFAHYLGPLRMREANLIK